MKKLLSRIFDIVFSEVGVILGMVFIILYILSSSFNDIRERLGFETINTVKIELEQTRQKLFLAEQENLELRRMYDTANKRCEILDSVIEEYEDALNKIDDIVEGTISAPTDEFKPGDGSLETDDNIVKIHTAYNQLFGSV